MKKLDRSDQNKIDNLIDCFESLCNGEKSNHIMCAIIVFLVKMHRKFSYKNISIEDHAENLKDTFINLNEDFDNIEK